MREALKDPGRIRAKNGADAFETSALFLCYYMENQSFVNTS